jgi:hypothetical protein
VALNHGELPVRARSGGELAERVRRAEDYAMLGARVVVELHSESHAAKPTTRAWAIARRADRSHRLAGQRDGRAEWRQADRSSRPDRPHQQPQERGWLLMPTDPLDPDQLDGEARFRADLAAHMDRLTVHDLAELLGGAAWQPPAAAPAGCAAGGAERAAARHLQAAATRRPARPR